MQGRWSIKAWNDNQMQCALKGAIKACPEKQQNIVSSLIQNGQPESLPNTKTCGSYMKLLRWCHECLSKRLWCNIDCMASFTELFFKVWIESAASWRAPLRVSKSAFWGIKCHDKNMTWGSWSHTTKTDVGSCMVCYLWISMAGCVCRCPKRFSATRFFSSVLGTPWSHRWSRSSIQNPPTGCFVPRVSNLSKWMGFLVVMSQIPIQRESKLMSLRNKCDCRWHLE